MTEAETDALMEHVAIIGMACRFPGASEVDTFWENLCNGSESITFFNDNELDKSIEPELLHHPDYVRARGIIPEAEMFDASFFDINRREAEIIDPQQRIFLETAWSALENAGYDPDKYTGMIGVFGGMGSTTYLSKNLSAHPDLLKLFGEFQTAVANDKSYLTTRVSYKLNLKGPSVNINTACSTSLVAICYAYESLVGYQCDIALAGGVTIATPQNSGYLFREGNIFSPDGHCRPFDARAQGTVESNGAGIVVLKRFAEAVKDNDYIYAILKGCAVNNDGSLGKMSFMSPSVDGQAEVIAMALANANVDAETISYIETHGTATPVGDPIEITALTQAFRAQTQKKQFCAIGSVKSNLGHLDAAAGIAGFIKTALSLQNKQIPPSLHFEKPNPKIDFASSPFYVNNTLSEWQSGPFPRRAGVSSFGVGGTNAHVILEEAPDQKPYESARPWDILLLSAKTKNSLEGNTQKLVGYLNKNRNVNISEVAYTLQTGRRHFKHRRIAVVSGVNDAIETLESIPSSRVFTAVHDRPEPQIAFMFTGQGAQYVNMAKELYEYEPIFREHIDTCAASLNSHMSIDLRQLIYPEKRNVEKAAQELSQTAFTQPALFSLEYALARMWMSWGVRPSFMIGHSIGEYVAACLAGVFSLDEALQLVVKRGQIMQSQEPGSMLAISIPESEVKQFLNGDCSLAAVNAPEQCVVSGSVEAIEDLSGHLTQTISKNPNRISFKRLHTSHAFHSHMMDQAVEPFKKCIGDVDFKPPGIPFVSNVTGTWITNDQATNPAYWASQLRQPVLFSQGIQTLLKEENVLFLEVGPGNTLSSLAGMHQKGFNPFPIVNSLPPFQKNNSDYAYVLNSLGKLWISGVLVDWNNVSGNKRYRRIPLPTYSFERHRFWLECASAEPKEDNATPMHVKPIPEDETIFQQVPGSPTQDRGRTEEIEPQNNLEARIRAVWEKYLGIAHIGVEDDFFDIGGNSLIALRIIPDLEKIAGKELPLATLFEAPTIGKLMEIFAKKEWNPSWSALVPIKPEGTKPPFFCVHGAGGNVLIYHGLAKQQDPDQPFYGIQCIGMDGKQPYLTKIEDMALLYINEMKKVQAEGPYLIGGYCMGGMVAFEMARQLYSRGEKTALLALFDSHREYREEKRILCRGYNLLQCVWFHARNIFIIDSFQGKYTFIRERMLEAQRRIFLSLKVLYAEITNTIRSQKKPPQVIMKTINDQACWNYVAKPYPGKVTIFRPRSAYRGYEDPQLGWGEICDEVEVRQLPCFPAGMLVEPFVSELAYKLREQIKKTLHDSKNR